MVLFVPGLSAPATTPRWALLSVVVPIIFGLTFEARKINMAHVLGALFLGWCAVTLAWTPNIWDGLDALWKLVLFAGLFCIGSQLPSLRPVWIGAALGIGVSSCFAIAQLFGVELVDSIEPPTGLGAGLFMNRNYLAEPAALVLIGVLGHRLWWAVPLVLPAVILPMARGPLLALAVVGMVWLWPRSRLAVLALAAAVSGAALIIPWTPNGSIPERIIIWASTLDGLTWFGNGLGSFYGLFPSHAPGWDFLATRPVHAHNDWLELVYEIGILPGICLFGALIMHAVMRGPDRLVLIAFITEGCLGFPLHFPATLFLAALVAGRLCGDRAPVRDYEHERRVALCLDVGCVLCPDGPCGECAPRGISVPARPAA